MSEADAALASTVAKAVSAYLLHHYLPSTMSVSNRAIACALCTAQSAALAFVNESPVCPQVHLWIGLSRLTTMILMSISMLHSDFVEASSLHSACCCFASSWICHLTCLLC